MVDKRRMFSSLFLREIHYYLEREAGILIKTRPPKPWQEVEEEGEALQEEAIDLGEFFYEGGGSMFSDYKSLRGRAAPSGIRNLTDRFDLNMSKEQIEAVAGEIIDEWMALKGRERKV